MSPAPSRLPKQVSDLRHALRLNVIDGLSWQRAAEGANSASQSVTAGLSAKITKCDVQRYGKKFREEFDEDATLCLARQNLNEALRNNPRDREARAVVVARGILDGLESSKKVELGRSIDKLQLKVAGNPQFNDARVFTDNEEMVMAESINQVSLCGFPFGYEEAQDLIAALAAKMGRPDFVASPEFMRGFEKRTKCIFSARNASNVAQERARAADPKTRKETFAKMDSFYANLHETEPHRYPWPSLSEMPAERKINFDETASDSNKGQDRVLASTEIDRYTLHRCFQVSYDKMPFHVTIVVGIKGDGTLLPPMVIHSAPGQEHPSVNHSVTENIYVKKQDGSGDYENVDDIIVDVSTNGSMTKELFAKYAEHLAKHLKDDGLGYIVFFDGHSSRWDPAALQMLLKRGIACFCLPSHTSIWSQPADNGTMRLVKKIAAAKTRAWQRQNRHEMTRAEWNAIFIEVYRALRDHLRVRLRDGGGKNEVTAAWENTGLHPYNPTSAPAWVAAEETLGTTALLERGDTEAVLNLGMYLGNVEDGAEASEAKWPACTLDDLASAELAALATLQDAGETPGACASRVVTARWKSFLGFEVDEWKPTDEATAAAFKACGSPHERAIVPPSEQAEAELRRGAQATIGAIAPKEAARLRRKSSGQDVVASRRVGDFLVTNEETQDSEVFAVDELKAAIGETFETDVMALAAASARDQAVRSRFARDLQARRKKEEAKHAKQLANSVIEARFQSEKEILMKEINVAVAQRGYIIEDEFNRIGRFFVTPRQVEILGTKASRTFNGEIVATRAMVVDALTGPLKAAASAAAEKKKKKRRNQGVPDTRTGLGVNEALKYLDEKNDAKDRKDAEKEAAAAEREKKAAEKFQLSFEKRLPEVFEDLASTRPTPIDELVLTKLVPLVKYLQEKHASKPELVVKMAHGKDEFKPKLLEEYERVKTTKANYRKYAAELSAARDARA